MPPQLQANAGKGRTKGVPNRVTRQVREAFALTLEKSTDQLRQWLYTVGRTDPVKGLEMAIALAQVATGKVRTSAEDYATNSPTGARAPAREAAAKCGEVPGVSHPIAPAHAREAPTDPERSAYAREDIGTEVSAGIAHARANVPREPHVQPLRIDLGDDDADPYNPM